MSRSESSWSLETVKFEREPMLINHLEYEAIKQRDRGEDACGDCCSCNVSGRTVSNLANE